MARGSHYHFNFMEAFTITTKCKGCDCDIINVRKTKGKLKSWCSESCRQKWRYKNRDIVPSQSTYIKQKSRGYLNKWKALQTKGAQCQQCGESRPATLCFHHRVSAEKEFPLDGRCFANFKWERIQKEVDKCDLLCHNCHNILHYGDSWNEFLSSLEE